MHFLTQTAQSVPAEKYLCAPALSPYSLFQNCNVPMWHTPHIFASSRCRRKNQFVGLTFWLSSAYILSSTEAATWGGPNEFEAAIPKPSSQKICPQAASRGNHHTFFVIDSTSTSQSGNEVTLDEVRVNFQPGYVLDKFNLRSSFPVHM